MVDRGQVGTTVDLQTVPVFEYVLIKLPPEDADEPTAGGVALRLSVLSADGYSIQAQAPGFLLLGKIVALKRLQMDIGRVVLPFAPPAAAVRQ